jgi:molybdate transport system substrate-binding protein
MPRFRPLRAALPIAAAILAAFVPACADDAPPAPSIKVAAAANLRAVAEELADAFVAEHGPPRPKFAYGSTGALASQILNGAAFDLFLSADDATPRRLVREGRARVDGPTPFATGGLSVVAGARSGLDLRRGLAVALDVEGRVAIADPNLAPFGRAAREAFGRVGLLAEVESKFVVAENVSQAFAFVVAGAAEVGVVATSCLYGLEPGVASKVVSTEVDPALYDAPDLSGVVLEAATDVEGARAFLRFVLGTEGRSILKRAGYGPPRDGSGATDRGSR